MSDSSQFEEHESPQKRGATNARLDSIEGRVNSLWGMIEPRLEQITRRLDEIDPACHRQPKLPTDSDMAVTLVWADHLTGRTERVHIRVDRKRAFGENLQLLVEEVSRAARSTLLKVLR